MIGKRGLGRKAAHRDRRKFAIVRVVGAAGPPAIGMIVAQAGVDTTEALHRLVDRAQATRGTVEETAVDVLEERLRFGGN